MGFYALAAEAIERRIGGSPSKILMSAMEYLFSFSHRLQRTTKVCGELASADSGPSCKLTIREETGIGSAHHTQDTPR
jgi:hypothetical protein